MMGRDITQTEWLKKRETVLERDGRQCQDCGKSESDAESLHVHHNIPFSEGGGHELDNLRTLCKFCHTQFHADERRKGTLEDIKDIYIRAEVPAFHHRDIAKRLGCSAGQARKKMKALVKKGFVEQGHGSVYFRSDLSVDHATSIGDRQIIIGGSLCENGRYIGKEGQISQCDQCGKYYFGEYAEQTAEYHRENHCSGKDE